MANPEHVEILKQGVKTWNRWRREKPEILPDLSETALSSANLSEVDFRFANLNSVNFRSAVLDSAALSGATLRSANLRSADLSFADLSFADLRFARLRFADLRSADLRSAILSYGRFPYAQFTETNLKSADFSAAYLYQTIFANVDLSETKNLNRVKHDGPSYISYETLLNPQNANVPEIFWRGCGVDKETLQHMKDRRQQPMQYESCFISYSHKDEEFARHLFERMFTANLRVWYAPEEMKGGEKIHLQIDQAIQKHDRLLIVLSEHSMNSEWVKTEIYNARQREIKENRRILFPLALVPFAKIRDWKFFDGETGKDLAREIREYFIPDFTDWKNHDVFEATFARLLRDLKLKSV